MFKIVLTGSFLPAQLKFALPDRLADPDSPVKNARRQRIKIVSLDWLEDSLLSSNRRPRREKEYEVGCHGT